MEQERPRVGIGVMILKEGKVLLGKRKGSHGDGEYQFPGGHLEHLESFEDCARREVAEECGLEIDHVRFQFLANVTHFAPKHYTHIGLLADWRGGEPQLLEPEKSGEWGWYDLNNLAKPLFYPCILAIQSHATGQLCFDLQDQ